jgi:hypothetical protein
MVVLFKRKYEVFKVGQPLDNIPQNPMHVNQRLNMGRGCKNQILFRTIMSLFDFFVPYYYFEFERTSLKVPGML